MDKTLERILSLLPRNGNGTIKHGERAKFAKSLGYKDGHIVSMWLSGDSDSYRGKLRDIAELYGVSVEWLKGETDERQPKQAVSEFDQAVLALVHSLPADKLRGILLLLGAPEELLDELDREERQG